MTLADAKNILSNLGMTLRYRDSEYRVNYRGGVEATAYYTNDIGDAIGTGRLMAESTPTRFADSQIDAMIAEYAV